MKTLSTLALASLLAVAAPSFANTLTVTLDFEGATSFAPSATCTTAPAAPTTA